MKSLAIDSTTRDISVSLGIDNSRSITFNDDTGRKHITSIMGMIEKVLKNNKVSIEDIELFGVNLGPGDFTGTRIGITVIKMFSWISGEKVFGFNALDVTSSMLSTCKDNKPSPNHIYLPVLDVRNEEVYYSFYYSSERDHGLRRKHPYSLCGYKELEARVLDFCKKTLKPSDKDYFIKAGGSALRTYPDIFYKLTAALESVSIKTTLYEEKSFTDSSYVLRLIEEYKDLEPNPFSDISPIYVRDFEVFGRK